MSSLRELEKNGGHPATNSNNIHPKLHISEAKE